MSWQASDSPVGPPPMMITSVLIVFISSSIKCHSQNTPSAPEAHVPKDVFSPPMTRINTFIPVFTPENPWLIKYTSEMYLSGYVATPACLLSSRRVETTQEERNEKEHF